MRADFNPGNIFSLNDFIQEGVLDKIPLIEEISLRATGESLIFS
jgi:hypothetical protein